MSTTILPDKEQLQKISIQKYNRRKQATHVLSRIFRIRKTILYKCKGKTISNNLFKQKQLQKNFYYRLRERKQGTSDLNLYHNFNLSRVKDNNSGYGRVPMTKNLF